ncbi:MAG: GxxExxY protein [Methanocalculus sp.]|uniref:GxxExxY protein n=1 Tax=Methanocalculus sp. TaxID=2004547 RepID=UPI00271DC5E1|nr:GxxExxY protein [Methanocalculus sp.]MDO9539064.1 GxxExxY protein [Methanocalculus sp.]
MTELNNTMFDENAIAKTIVDSCFHIHINLGPGLLESVYEAILFRELIKRGLRVQRQVVIPIIWDGQTYDEGFRADLIVEDKVIIELKSVERIAPVHGKQLLTYIRLTNRRLGLIVNFGEAQIKNGIKRVVNGLPDDISNH